MVDMSGSFAIMAVDPSNPDRLVARIDRDHDSGVKDTLLESVDAGKTFRAVMDLGELDAAAFTPDGKLYFGDNDQNERKLYVMDKAGGDAQMIGSGWKVSCLTWDDSKKRMLGCNDFKFGTVDLDVGTFNIALDMRCAPGPFVECPGSMMTAADACKAQLTAAYCGYGHYPAAPLCMPYDTGPDAAELIASAGYKCKDGMVTDSTVTDPPGSGTGGPPLATGGMSGTVAAAGMSGGTAPSVAGSSGGTAGKVAPTSAGAGTTAPPPPPKSSGCSCALVDASRHDASSAWLLGVCGVLSYGAIRRLRRSR
jgi:hypothetical protein